MVDTISPERRSWNMSRIRGSNTSIEKLVRKELFRKGFRFRINTKNLPGKPDIVLKKYNAVIFINGCFWHGHIKCKAGRIPKSRVNYWREKIDKNIERDEKNLRKLRRMGWRVMTVWECQINNNLGNITNRIEKFTLKHHVN
ncbi:MAG: very short patch repair endonuclease [Candidatus Sumerlaeota bacterium]|nr:very short patch repair endonuclease [Candidatus Sumerlaeota bacterium]